MSATPFQMIPNIGMNASSPSEENTPAYTSHRRLLSFEGFIWGYQENLKEVGNVADYCPNCRKIREFHLFRVLRQSTIYFVSVDEGTFRTYLGICRTCECITNPDPFCYRTALAPEDIGFKTHLLELTGITHPDIFNRYGKLITTDASRPANPPSIGEREIETLLRKYENIATSATWEVIGDWIAGLWIIATILISGGLLLYALLYEPDPVLFSLPVWAGIIFAGMFPYSIYQAYMARYRILNNTLIPDLSELFSHFSIRKQELNKAVRNLKEENLWTGYIDGNRLWNRIEERQHSNDRTKDDQKQKTERGLNEERIESEYAEEKKEIEQEQSIRECFRACYPEAEKKLSSSLRVDLYGGISFAITVFFSVVLYGALDLSGIPFLEMHSGKITLGFFLLMFALTLYVTFTSHRRYKNNDLLPELLAKSSIKRAQKEQLSNCLKHMESLGMEMGKQLTAEELLEIRKRP